MDHVRENAFSYAQTILSTHNTTGTPEGDVQRVIAFAKIIETYLKGFDPESTVPKLKGK